MKTFFDLLSALPALIKLIQAIQKAIDEEKIEGKVKDNVAKIHDAFVNKDGAALTELFNSK